MSKDSPCTEECLKLGVVLIYGSRDILQDWQMNKFLNGRADSSIPHGVLSWLDRLVTGECQACRKRESTI